VVQCLRPVVGRLGLALALALAIVLPRPAIAANPADYAVQVQAVVNSAPAAIELNWVQDSSNLPLSYTVYRKSPDTTDWGVGTVLPGTATQYSDTSVVRGMVYEYQIVRTTSTYKGFGYIQSGIEIPLVESRGTVVLMVDNSMSGPLAAELSRLESDLIGDGWMVRRHDVGRNDSVPTIKALIAADYASDPANVRAVFLFGRIPVPYAGRMAPDSHPEHYGAWPADVYYGDINGSWTDSSVTAVQSLNASAIENARLTNLPGDGKFDQSAIPGLVELQVGRVDFSNMPGLVAGVPTFASEQELLRHYLDKDHAFRHSLRRAERRAVVADYFGEMNGEAFAASGYRFAPLVGAENLAPITAGAPGPDGGWIGTLSTHDYLLAYGCGGGTFTSIAGIGTTTDIVQSNAHAVFSLVFGSYFGDWDSQDNVMRALLATADGGLAAGWAGRPHWFLHPMGLGETIGYSTRLTENAWGIYQNQMNAACGFSHVALMGDPTLRLHPVAPVVALTGSLSGSTATLSWDASAEASLGYHVYRADSPVGPFTRITTQPVTASTFVDATATSGLTYMVRAVKLEATPSGSYVNASQGLFWSTGGTLPLASAPVTSASPTTTTLVTSSPALGATTVTAPVATDAVSAPAAPVPTNANGDAVWFDDSLPRAAIAFANGGDLWDWATGNAFSGTTAHRSTLSAGLHEHGFTDARATLAIQTGDTLFVHVYLDPKTPPTEILLTWVADNSEHRAYWGVNKIEAGKPGTASRRFVGKIPAAGQWVMLTIPAKDLALEGQTVTGLTFSQYGGRATWDYVGKIGGGAP
jgi:hypothetical protein